MFLFVIMNMYMKILLKPIKEQGNIIRTDKSKILTIGDVTWIGTNVVIRANFN